MVAKAREKKLLANNMNSRVKKSDVVTTYRPEFHYKVQILHVLTAAALSVSHYRLGIIGIILSVVNLHNNFTYIVNKKPSEKADQLTMAIRTT